ncbi:putative bifunctional diguanylate cyclase/phosphodiesterase [Duganella sp. Dugasp56]|uniref:putative bifunctional diguanylate cyclase/phosphodiesterase n=1 Tax=Duganella sp. Dugasp56 TaxID=3243046 RepID=UPI0039B072B2
MNTNTGDPPVTERRSGEHGSAHDRRATGRARAVMLAGGERQLARRETLVSAREQAADRHDADLQQREQALALRHKHLAAREQGEREARRIKRALERHIIKLRRANAHLVIATLGAQAMMETVQRAKEHMGYMAHHDFLTDLPNRILLMERLALAIAMARRQQSRMAVLFIDLDRFKVINDSLGHAVGDLLLQSVGRRLLSVLRASDTASRQGGDEFVVLLADVANERAVSELADKLCLAIAEPYLLDGETAHIGGTIGISMYPDDGEDAETLIRNADVAMYYGKHSGRNRWYFYRPEMNLRAVERQRTEADLHRALKLGEFELHYQPRVNLASGAITGAEALLRWSHPELGAVAPARFIPVAEDCGLIVPIGQWVLREACMQISRWKQVGLDPGIVAVNISALEFRTDGFADALRAILAESGLEPACLELEITEGVLMRDAGASTAILRELKEIGVVLAIDDFGTGYSSLSYLNRFPIDVLKIDQSFVRDISTAPGDGIIVGAVIAMGSSLGQRVVAEGVEETSQLNFLRAHHCDEGQGYLFSKPLPAPGFAALLRQGLDS